MDDLAISEKVAIFAVAMNTPSYRPRNPGHDYYGRGTYLITLVVRGREHLLACFERARGGQGQPAESGQGQSAENGRLGETAAGVFRESVVMTPLGEAVKQFWQQIPVAQAVHGNRVVVHACVCMPDHFHGVVEVLEPMTWSLGDIIQAFKSVCTGWWQRQEGLEAQNNRPIPAVCRGEAAPEWLRLKAAMYSSEGALVRHLSKKQRQEYYAFWEQQEHTSGGNCPAGGDNRTGGNWPFSANWGGARLRQPLFDDNYDDTVCLDERHRLAMIAYVRDNPRRALLRRMLPGVMERCLHVEIGGRRYGAFGNLFLLRWARKIQVMCHRKHPVTRQPYEETEDYVKDCRQWERAIMEGATVIVTPGISTGERLMKQECLKRGFPLIHLQKEAIGPYWKPELQCFEACARGSLLILAPWDLDGMGGVAGVPAESDYSRFHNLNTLAAEICAFDGEARIIRGK